MKKYWLKSMAALAFGGIFTSCSHDMDLGGSKTNQSIQETYEEAFVSRFGEPAPTQTWGFGASAASTRSLTRSIEVPYVDDIPQPYFADDVRDYLATATEANDANVVNDDAGADLKITAEPVFPGYNKGPLSDNIQYSGGSNATQAQINFYNDVFAPGLAAYEAAPVIWSSYNNEKNYIDTNNAKIQLFLDLVNAIADAEMTLSDWLSIYTEPAFGAYSTGDHVMTFKITETWNKAIPVMGGEGDGGARTLYVTGTWNIPANTRQSVGGSGGGLVVIADGGTINVGEGSEFIFDNQARLVVLPGGRLTGAGTVNLANGTADGREAFNAGTIDVYDFNNNGGKFFNYGLFKPTILEGSSANSCFYNHGIVHIKTTLKGGRYNTDLSHIFNACQWYCEEDMCLRNLEMISGSSFIVGGELKTEAAGDATGTESYVSLADGAYVQAGTFFLNGTAWYGPTSGHAVAKFGKVTHLDWHTDEIGGYFHNNLYVCITDQSNEYVGNNHYLGEGVNSWLVKNMFWAEPGKFITEIKEGNTEVIPASEGFVLGESGCTPGFKGNIEDEEEKEEDPVWESIRVIAEDLTVDQNTDFDFNDVVFDVRRCTKGNSTIATGTVEIVLQAAGGTLPLYVDGKEVHDQFGVDKNVMVNTKARAKGYNGKDDAAPVTWTTTNYSGSTIGEIANSIRVYVKKTVNGVETDCVLTAPEGEVASKIAVGIDYDWCDERQDLDDKFHLDDGTSLFKSYVRGEIGDNWYRMVKTEIDNQK